MSHNLTARTILIVEDEPLAASAIAQACEQRGAFPEVLIDILVRLLNLPNVVDAAKPGEVKSLRETTRQLADDLARDRARMRRSIAKTDRLIESSKASIEQSRILLDRYNGKAEG